MSKILTFPRGLKIKMIADWHHTFLNSIFEICAFYPYTISQFWLAKVQVLNSHIDLVAAILDSTVSDSFYIWFVCEKALTSDRPECEIIVTTGAHFLSLYFCEPSGPSTCWYFTVRMEEDYAYTTPSCRQAASPPGSFHIPFLSRGSIYMYFPILASFY